MRNVQVVGLKQEKIALILAWGIPVPPQMWGLVEEQMAYVTHKVANNNIMRNFKENIYRKITGCNARLG